MRQTSAYARLWAYMKTYRLSFFLAVFFKILGAIMNALEPLILGFMITEITANVMAIARGDAGAGINYPYVGILLLIYLIRGGIYSLSSWLSNLYMTKAVQSTIRDIRKAMSCKINSIPTSYFDRHQFGDMLGRFTSDVETVSNTLQQSFLQIVNAILTVVFAVTMAIYINAGLSFIVILSIPITYVSARFILSKSQPYFTRQAAILGEMNAFVQENLTGFNVLKLYQYIGCALSHGSKRFARRAGARDHPSVYLWFRGAVMKRLRVMCPGVKTGSASLCGARLARIFPG